MPPRPPFFTGRGILAAEAPSTGGPPLLSIRPRAGHVFTAPAGTHTLYVPPASLVSATPVGAAVELVGDFKRVNYPPRITLAPVDEGDAIGLCLALARRYGLPRAPLDLSSRMLRRGLAGVLVSVVDAYRPGHCEAPNFGGLVVDTPDRAALVADEVYRVTGFYGAGRADDASGPLAVGYNGPALAAVAVERPPCTAAALDPLGGRVDARLGEAHGRWISDVGGGRRLVGLVHGKAAQGFAPMAAEVLLAALRRLVLPPAVAAAIGPIWAQVDALLDASVDRGPLPEEATALLVELDRRFGVALTALREAYFTLFVDGALACVDGRRIAVLRRGHCRVYRTCPNGQVILELVEDTLGRLLDAQGLEVEAWKREAVISLFGQAADDDPGTRILELAPGERLVALSGSILRARSAAQIEDALAERDLTAVVRRLEGAGPALEDDKWGALLIAPGPAGAIARPSPAA